MLKKISLSLIFLSSVLSANINFDVVGQNGVNYDDLSIPLGNKLQINISKDANEADFEDKDWIAVFKKGAENKGINVIEWQYLSNNTDKFVLKKSYGIGEYDIRLYKNNSYIIASSGRFKIVANYNPSISVANIVKNNYILFNNTTANKAWIGIYKVGDSNEWKNVKAWSWANTNQTKVSIKNLQKGDYDARLFYNNSYNKEANVNFKIDNAVVAEISIENIDLQSVTFHNTTANKAWIGIYKRGDSNDWENVKAWSWANTNQTKISIKNLQEGDYDARLFYNNSFHKEANIEFKKQKPQNNDGIKISEVMAANTNTIYDPDYFNYSDWIELYNGYDKAVDISGYKISDKLNKPKWIIPENTIIPANGYILIWADGKDKTKKSMHTNFKLKMKGEAVALFDKNDQLIDSLVYKKQIADISITKMDNNIVYMHPTPNKPNSNYYKKVLISDIPTISKKSGFYNNQISVKLSAVEGATIYYTIDGSIPSTKSLKYTEPILINKTGSIRAISVENGKFSSPVVTQTYIFDNDNFNMPVIAISVDEKYLYDDMIGIYTVGKNGKKIKDCDPKYEGVKANYAQKWERPAHMVMFEEDKKVVLSQDFGLKISGECSRVYNQKSFQLKADSKYGEKKFKYKVFADKNIKKYERLKLRNAGQDTIKTHMRDALAQMIVKDQLNVSYEAYRPAVVYINGKYWGVYGLREKLGKEYLEENFGAKDVNLLEDDTVIKEGNSDLYDELNEFLRANSLVSKANYEHVLSIIDIDNYIDYMITNIYVGNSDWPGTNLVFWNDKKENKKYKWLLHDMDFGFGMYASDGYGVEFNTIAFASEISDVDWPNPEWSTLLFRKLLENTEFKTKFKNRFLTLLDTTFAPQRVNSIIDQIVSKISPQMQRHIDRWTIDGEYSYAVENKDDWLYEVNKLKNFANNRPKYIKEHLDKL